MYRYETANGFVESASLKWSMFMDTFAVKSFTKLTLVFWKFTTSYGNEGLFHLFVPLNR